MSRAPYATIVVSVLAAFAVGCGSLLGAEFDHPAAAGDAAVGAGDIDASSPDDQAACTSPCGAPPAASCIDGKTLRVFVAPSDCSSEVCAYPHYDVVCADRCESGACTGNDPCASVTCVAPPPPACADDSTLETYAASGICSGGTCTYQRTRTTCSKGCESGACAGDPCAGVTCNQPPTATCLDASTRRSYAQSGTCSAGRCSYAITDTPCANGCSGGTCAGNPCAGVTCTQPPAASCVDATTLRTFAATGTCSGGTCSYTSTTTACSTRAHGDPVCTSGACDFTCRSGYSRCGNACCASTVCYHDGDGDGYGDQTLSQTVAGTCPTGWTSNATKFDCLDIDPLVHPGQTTYFDHPYTKGSVQSYDYDCNGTEDKESRPSDTGSTCGYTTGQCFISGYKTYGKSCGAPDIDCNCYVFSTGDGDPGQCETGTCTEISKRGCR